MVDAPEPKPTEFMGSSREDLKAFPQEVRAVFGYAIFLAQIGDRHPDAKPLRGDKAFSGAGVLEVVDDFDSDTYRAVYTVRLAGVVYVLHCFQKKAKSRIATPKKEIAAIKARLAAARRHYELNYLHRKKA